MGHTFLASMWCRLSPHSETAATAGRQQKPCLNCSPAASWPRLKAVYTDQDAAPSCQTFSPPLLDISNLLAGEQPTQHQIREVQQECLETGFLALAGVVDEVQLRHLFAAAQTFFDLPLEVKTQYVVEDMQRGRGYEISPEHKAYMQQHCSQVAGQQPSSSSSRNPEPSAAAAILSERFVCGRPLTSNQCQDPYYTSDLGQVFFTRDSFPSSLVPELQPAMQQQYRVCEEVANAVLRLFAAALGLPPGFFCDKVDKHHSNLQVANYPSQLLPPGDQLRKKAHVDSGTLTLLASQDWMAGSSWQAGVGGLQLMNSQGQWAEVEVPRGESNQQLMNAATARSGALLLNLGSLMTRWTNGLWKSTLHRVTNPVRNATNSRRLSMAYFHKPNFDAIIEPVHTCFQQQPPLKKMAAAAAAGLPAGPGVPYEQLPAGQLFPAAAVGDLTRQGILHQLRHLPPEEASRRYHEALAAMRRHNGSDELGMMSG